MGDESVSMPVVVVRDRKSKIVFANVAPTRGINSDAVKRIAQHMPTLGYRK